MVLTMLVEAVVVELIVIILLVLVVQVEAELEELLHQPQLTPKQ